MRQDERERLLQNQRQQLQQVQQQQNDQQKDQQKDLAKDRIAQLLAGGGAGALFAANSLTGGGNESLSKPAPTAMKADVHSREKEPQNSLSASTGHVASSAMTGQTSGLQNTSGPAVSGNVSNTGMVSGGDANSALSSRVMPDTSSPGASTSNRGVSPASDINNVVARSSFDSNAAGVNIVF